jgi:hypothetical protein
MLIPGNPLRKLLDSPATAANSPRIAWKFADDAAEWSEATSSSSNRPWFSADRMTPNSADLDRLRAAFA